VNALLLVAVAITSLAAVAALVRGGVAGLGAAIGAALEVIGATLVFFVANVTVGVAVVLVARSLSIFYTTLYEVADISLLVIALVQAITLTAWRLSAPPR
jgi:hypothetical protein